MNENSDQHRALLNKNDKKAANFATSL